ncbi:aminodeoxychorismate synthase component I [Lacisediminimonas sp.]|uniref:aminodeoxychorismate synthase component I n=1 Tax=Lacisediminimonas sp. TaxID=3060582 RepID=UPI0027284241|nr:aminodeoxychorismate synthase component I [Lacisediminimonas sp.]MDO8300275.1 aminodeoxychorismate synthase component I [Lacisediminimonas sp.]
MTAFALLDDCAGDGSSRLYTGHVDTLTCDDWSGLAAMLDELAALQASGGALHALALLDYELGGGLHRVAPHPGTAAAGRILLFAHCEHLSSAQVESWLEQQGSGNAGVAQVTANISEAGFGEHIARIRSYIEAGDTYQVNYTMRLRFQCWGEPAELYRRLRLRQPAPYGALIVLPDGAAIVSLSPELFLQHHDGQLTARPMKGTAAASADPAQDAALTAELAADPKNRAENLMIVDLLRNDLGRVAALGSVVVPSLFDVRRHGAVLQMTSTIHANLRDDVSLAGVLAAVYPCGSITGAPKRRTMQIIRELEDTPRGIYTGAIGWLDAPPPGRQVGDFCLSVPIRTLQLAAPGADGWRSGEMGVGAGIVHDSEATAEYRECQLKAQFLTGLQPGFSLFETLYATPSGARHLERHLQRLAASAARFGFALDQMALRAAIAGACAALDDASGPYRMRVALHASGEWEIETARLAELTAPVRLLVAADRTDAADLFLQHKTTLRERYDLGWRNAEAQGAFDTLFFNTRGELTEGGRSNVFVKLDGRWVTPPLSCGLLPGVMRSVHLEEGVLQASEQIVSRQDLQRAEAVMVCNALRARVAAQVDWAS